MTRFIGLAPMVARLRLDLKKAYRDELQQAGIAAVNQTAFKVREALKVDMKRVFDRPTPTTLYGMLVKQATIETPAAVISIKDNSPRSKSGPPVGHYLSAEILGGDRHAKRSEVALRLAGVMEGSQFEMPSREAVLDLYGNLPSGDMTKILSAVKAFGEQGYLANRSKRSRGKKKGFKSRQTGTPYFVAKSKSTGQPLGIWQVVGSGQVKPVLIFANKVPDYSVRFPFDELVEKHAGELFPAEIVKALRDQLHR